MERLTIEQKKAERLLAWKQWIGEFIETNEDATPIPNAAELLNDYYWRLVEYFLKPMLKDVDEGNDHNIHYYKIISASELTVMAVVPFKLRSDKSDENRKHLNAEFAWLVATSIFINWKIDGRMLINIEKLDAAVFSTELILKNGGEEKFYPLNIMEEHIEWLKDLNTAGPLPVLGNSQTWRALFYACKIDN